MNFRATSSFQPAFGKGYTAGISVISQHLSGKTKVRSLLTVEVHASLRKFAQVAYYAARNVLRMSCLPVLLLHTFGPTPEVSLPYA